MGGCISASDVDSSSRGQAHEDKVSSDKRSDDNLSNVQQSIILKSDLLKPSDMLNMLAEGKSTAYRKGMKGDEIKSIQKTLLQFGFDLGNYGADGIFGESTEAVVKLFQQKYIPSHKFHEFYSIDSIDGIVGKNTILALDEALMDRWNLSNLLWKIIFYKKKIGFGEGPYNQLVQVLDANSKLIIEVRGSSKPNPFSPKNPKIKGEEAYPYVLSGTYHVQHGLHKGKPALVLNSNDYVPTRNVNPNHPSYGKKANYIHIHWGYSKTWKGSAGCMTIHPEDWNNLLFSVPDGEGEVIIK